MTKQAAWLTDIHLNFVKAPQIDAFLDTVRATQADVVLISGDIGEAPSIEGYLEQIDRHLDCPVYFVLGNHDFYNGGFTQVRDLVQEVCEQSRWLSWLPALGILELTPETALVGHDGWADGRLGDWQNSDVWMNDYLLIKDFIHLDKNATLRKLNDLGDTAAEHVRAILPPALARYPKVIFMTHVPPFRDACWHEGQISDDNFLPHFACKAMGDALAAVMRAHPENQLLVLCGHTHGAGQAQILDNLLVLTGGATYGEPEIQQLLSLR